MANFATAAYVKAQLKLNEAFNKMELRYRVPEIHNLFLQSTNTLIPEAEAARLREDRPATEFSYITRTARSLGSARAHNHTGAQGDSGVLTPTWASYTDKFVSSLKEADGKVYSWEELHMSKMQNAVINFAEGLESTAATYLFANRSGVNTATTEGTFDATDDTFEITDSTNGTRAIQITKMVMEINKYQGYNYSVVCDAIAFNKFQYLASQGISNSTNTSFQFGGVRFLLDPSLTTAAAGLVSAYAKGYWIVVPDGSIACPSWIPIQNRMGKVTTVASYGSLINPIDSLQYALHTYETSADGSSIGGYLQDVKIETEISVDLAYTHAPLSTASASPLMAFALV